MKNKRHIKFWVLTFACFIGSTVWCQNIKYESDVKALGSLLKDIRSSKATLHQALAIVNGNILQFSQVTEDLKGKSTRTDYRFNPADIDPKSVILTTLGMEMNVDLKTKNGHPYIEVVKDQLVTGYKAGLSISGFDIDNARALIDAVKIVISSAELMEAEKYQLSSYEEALSRIAGSVVDVTVPSKVPGIEQFHVQKIAELPEKKGKFELIDRANDTERKYQFNLSDIELNSIEIMIFLRNVSVKFNTKGDASIVGVQENNVRRAFESSFQIYPKDIENAKQIQQLFKLMIRMSQPDSVVASAESGSVGIADSTKTPAASPSIQQVSTNLEPKKIGETISSEKITVSEPEWVGEIVSVSGKGDTGILLESQTASIQTKAGASMYIVGVGKVTSRASVRGEMSPIRIQKEDTLYFVYRHQNNDANPRKIIELYQFEKKGKTRVLEVGTLGTFSGSSIGDLDRLNLSVEKYGKNSYLIKLANPVPGEYGFILGEIESKDIELFGVDL
jgi:hypothetical protein